MASNRGPPGQIPTYADLEELRMSLIAIPNSMDKGTDAALNARLRALAPANMHAKLKQQEREIARLELERDNALNKGKAVEEARIQLALETAARVKAGYKNNTLAAKLASIEMERDMLVKYSKTEPLQAK
ncbi:hypothetical protein BDV95DRAFT_83033 [Massariosphaeria phaeospora]|uniref:Uncharacterized protein n=1 Tax=Massariosphaeria phaeospora TaxID=100035 RepID=A0A7C8M613_9PLEO|nr:hypothetical protein BDV95DRAFT_83033 [Massariosphaeria phaeospora]